MFPFGFAPQGWAECNGQELAITDNQSLFAVLGTTYGGDGRTSFRLPDLRGRVPLHASNQATQGQVGGAERCTLSLAQLGTHQHSAGASSNADNVATVAGNVWAATGSVGAYAPTTTTELSGQALSATGGSQSHNNMQPTAVANFCIALTGLFPPRN